MVTKRTRQGIGRIITRRTSQFKQHFHHVLYLLFICVAAANDGFFDLCRSVLRKGDIVQRDRADGCSPCLAKLNCRARVLVHKHALCTGAVRPVQVDQLFNSSKNNLQPLGEAVAGDPNGAAINVDLFTAITIDNAETGNPGPRINTDNSDHAMDNTENQQAGCR